MKYINSSQGSQSSKNKKSEINDKINKNNKTNIIYMNKKAKEKENDTENSENFDQSKKLTLYNLENDDKLLLKALENKNALSITDISSLNKKNIVNYNISLSDFNIKNILKYYIYLLNEKEKGQIELNDLKKEVGELREDYLKVKKDEINNSKANSNILDDKNFDTINIEKLSPVSRYKNDIKFFENLIIKMNNEIKNT